MVKDNKEKYFLQYGKKVNGKIVCSEEVDMKEFFKKEQDASKRAVDKTLAELKWYNVCAKVKIKMVSRILGEALDAIEYKLFLKIKLDEARTELAKSMKKKTTKKKTTKKVSKK